MLLHSLNLPDQLEYAIPMRAIPSRRLTLRFRTPTLSTSKYFSHMPAGKKEGRCQDAWHKKSLDYCEGSAETSNPGFSASLRSVCKHCQHGLTMLWRWSWKSRSNLASCWRRFIHQLPTSPHSSFRVFVSASIETTRAKKETFSHHEQPSPTLLSPRGMQLKRTKHSSPWLLHTRTFVVDLIGRPGQTWVRP